MFYTCWVFFLRFFSFPILGMLIVHKEHQAFELPCHLHQTVHAWQIDITYHNICQSLYLRYTNLLGVSVISLFTLWHWFPQFILISECEYLSEDHWQNRTSDKMSSLRPLFPSTFSRCYSYSFLCSCTYNIYSRVYSVV